MALQDEITSSTAKTGRKQILYFSLPARITRLVLSGLALLAQEFVDVALRRHSAFLDSSRNIHHLLLVLLLLMLLLLLLLLRLRLRMRLRLMMRHWCMVIAIQARWRGLVLDFRRVLIVQRRVQERSVGAHGGEWRRRRALFQSMDAMVLLRGYGCVGVFDAGAGFLGSGKARRGGGAQGWCALCGERLEVRAKKVERASG